MDNIGRQTTAKSNTDEIMNKRIKHLEQNCNILKNTKGSSPIFSRGIPIAITMNTHHICKVPKSGSTFWTEVFLTLSNVTHVDNLGNLTRDMIHVELQEKIVSRNLNARSLDTLLIISRDPWKRIYSAYMDKIYQIQTAYRDQIKHMIGKYRGYCGEVPTFEQFLKYIVAQSKYKLLDPHWRPISSLCRVCRYSYKYIMKMESFEKDSTYVLNKILPENSDKKKALLSKLANKQDYLKGLVKMFTSRFLEMKDNCVSFIDTMKRLWFLLQSQGLLSDRVNFSPRFFLRLSAVNEEEITELFVKKSKEIILSKAEEQQQRNRHFKEAYASVDVNVLLKIQKVYENDFRLFGYNMRLTLD
ncbi:unnamed protein product [Mytilus edulis]|uniref:Carbohydrate sulfotransferase n=1 Tax=Mytilus edulis TaxID=6550 RepID=A0A8S3QM23_MYTED|nr:unnamed protein product [Mytilus edulis]